MELLQAYKNGNTYVQLYTNGTRIISSEEDEFRFETPLNIDIRVSTQCSFGLNTKTGKSFCDFCHESALVKGVEADYSVLQSKLIGLPAGIELAIGANDLSESLIAFLKWSKDQGYVCNLTINQGHLRRDLSRLLTCINESLISGLGVSYRSSLKWNVPRSILEYPHTVFHVINGIDDVLDIKSLANKGVRKILCLGEKDFGFNEGRVDLTTSKHRRWYWDIRGLFDLFEVVSFDNLGLDQLRPDRFISTEDFKVIYQGEYSMYIDAANKVFRPSSRDKLKLDWNSITVSNFFKEHCND